MNIYIAKFLVSLPSVATAALKDRRYALHRLALFLEEGTPTWILDSPYMVVACKAESSSGLKMVRDVYWQEDTVYKFTKSKPGKGKVMAKI